MFSFFKGSSGPSGPGGGAPGTGLGFDAGSERRLPNQDKHLFRLHEGTLRDRPGTRCSVFVCADPDLSPAASAAVKRMKTLRHPSVLTYLDSSESGGRVSVATEEVTPLSAHLDELDAQGVRGAPRDQYLAWGLFQVLRGLSFLNNDAKLRHNSLHGDAVFVTRAGDWKLFALDRVTPADPDSHPAAPRLQALQKYEPPESSDESKRRACSPWSRDTWGLGCIIWEIFNGPLPAARNLGQLGSIPKPLSPLYMECVAANPAKRPNPRDRMESLRRSGSGGASSYFRNRTVDAMLFLEEIQLKEEAEKTRFYSSLLQLSDDLPPHLAAHKVLPCLLKAMEFDGGASAASVLGAVLKIGRKLSPEEYVELVVPLVLKMFASNDRNARFKLLSQIDQFAEHLSEKLTCDEIFPRLEGGFSDGEPAIREKTVIAVVHLAPKLGRQQLDDNVVQRHFPRLLRDEQPGIRTNTAVCLGKIAPHLHHSTRQKVLLPAFTGKLRDPFPPARIAAVNALAATQQFFTIAETANRVLPCLCPALADPEEPVRLQAFKVTKGFLDKLEQVSKNPDLREEMEAEVNASAVKAGGAAASSSVAGWASWAVGAIGAKFYKSAAATPPPQQQQANSSSNADGKQQQQQQQPRRHGSEEKSSEVSQVSMSSSDNASNSIAAPAASASGDGWDDGNDDDDGDWGSLETTAETKQTSRNEDDDFDKLSARASGAMSLSSRKKPEEDSWDSWGDDLGGGGKKQEDKDEERRLREEKRAARRAELAAKREARKGPMKLGAKKD